MTNYNKPGSNIIMICVLIVFTFIQSNGMCQYEKPGVYIVEQDENGCKIEKWGPDYSNTNRSKEMVITDKYLIEKLQMKYGVNTVKKQIPAREIKSETNQQQVNGFCKYKLQKISREEAMAMKVNDLEILRTMPSSFYGTMVTCPVIIHDIDEQRPGFRLIVTDLNGNNPYNLPFYVSRFVDFSDRPFILELMKVKKQPMIIRGMVNTFSETKALKIDSREFLLIED